MLKIEVIPASQAPAALISSHTNRNDDWDHLTEQLQDIKRGDWIRLYPQDLPGTSVAAKRHNLRKAIASRGVNLVTCILGSHLYIRVRTDADPKRTSK
jgi:hypothetical protein